MPASPFGGLFFRLALNGFRVDRGFCLWNRLWIGFGSRLGIRFGSRLGLCVGSRLWLCVRSRLWLGRFDQLTGVSTAISMYMSPRVVERSTVIPLPLRRYC